MTKTISYKIWMWMIVLRRKIFLVRKLNKNLWKLFWHSFVAKSLANLFPRTILRKVRTQFPWYAESALFPCTIHWKENTFWDMVLGKWELSARWYSESKSKFTNISMKLEKKSNIFYGVKTRAWGCQFMKNPELKILMLQSL